MDFNLNSRAKGVVTPSYAQAGVFKTKNNKDSIFGSNSIAEDSTAKIENFDTVYTAASDASSSAASKNYITDEDSLTNNSYEEQIARESKEEIERKAKEKLERAKEALDVISHGQIALRFEESKDFEGSQVVNVVDVESNEVIRQIPSEEFLKVSDIIEKFSDAREARQEASKGFNPYRMSSYQQNAQDKSAQENDKTQDVDVSELQQDHRGAFLDFEA